MKSIVILGGGESGYGSAILAKKEGCKVFLSDRGELALKYRDALIAANIDFEEGEHTMSRILSADIVVKSPGIPETADVVRQLRVANIEIVSEMEFACKFTKSKIISITGSNGKTTTATLIYKILKEGGVNVTLAGNIGDSFAYSVATENPDWYVLELSSFQLDGCYSFKSDIAIINNITPDHLDRYQYDMNLYVNSKFRVCQNQTQSDYFIYTATDAHTKSYMATPVMPLNACKLPIHTSFVEVEEGGYMSEDMSHIICRAGGYEIKIFVSALEIKGLHNYANIMDSVLCALIVGVDPKSIINSVSSFGGVEHRLESAGSVDGVNYINDSKATNVDSAWYALDSVKHPTVWIAGGTDKGNDYSQLFEVARKNVHTLVCMGLDNEKLKSSFSGIIPNIIDANSLDMAFAAAVKSANKGDVVLLSPCCASFDLFKNYEDRGCQFKMKVENLK